MNIIPPSFTGLLLAALACIPAAAQNYTVETFRVPVPKDSYTYGQGINDSGDIVGFFEYGIGEKSFLYGFERHADGTLDYPLIDPDGEASDFTDATGIDNSGEITGFYYASTGADGFLLNQGVYQAVSELGSPNTWILGINNNGDFVGATGPITPPTNGFISVGGTATQYNVPGATGTVVNGIADNGSVVGTATINGHNVGFLRGPNGNLKLFQIAKSLQYTIPTGINSTSGLIVGYYIAPNLHAHGFVYRYRGKAGATTAGPAGRGASPPAVEAIDAETVDAAQTGDTYIQGVNASGVLVGIYRIYHGSNPERAIAFTAVPIP